VLSTHAHAEINSHPDRHRDKNPSPPRAKSPRAGRPRSTHAHAEINPHPDWHRDKNPSPPRANPSPDRCRDQNPSPPSTETPPEINRGEGRAMENREGEESYGEHMAQRPFAADFIY
jgi:hypothetical protein